MGRLTLNILLSFAQFEREIIAERTRDKMAAAKRKGKWTGGHPVLGYDVDPNGGRLVVNDEEAQRVRAIFALYAEYQALLPTVRELNRRDWTTKHWTTRKGRECGGRVFVKSTLQHLLTNVLYIGKQTYYDEVHEGEQPAIVEAALWDTVQATLRENSPKRGRLSQNKNAALLKGLLVCGPCNCSMGPTYTTKKQKRYRYYVCSSAQQRGWDTCPTRSVPAAEMERFVVDHIRRIGRHPALVKAALADARRKDKSTSRTLEAQKRQADKELRQLGVELRRAVGKDSDQLAAVQQRIDAAERRATEVREQLTALGASAVDEGHLAQALERFDPLWDVLKPQERVRIVQLLVERVSYDGQGGTVAVTFRATGIKTLAEEEEGT